MSEKGRTVTDFDISLGRIIRLMRLRMGLSQKQLAKKSGITFQMLQRYEVGINRVSVRALCQIADAMEVPTSVLLNETKSKYIRDELMLELIETLYKLPTNKRKLIHIIACSL